MPGDLTRPEILPAALSGVDRAFLFPVFNVVDGFFEAARQADLQHVVLLSSAAITYSTPGWISEQHLQLERAVAGSGLPWTYVRPDGFMTNDLAWKHQIVNGGVVRGAYGHAASAPVDPRDIAAVAVRAESLANIGKHAQATSAAVEVSQTNGQLVVEIVDDGVGARPSEPERTVASSSGLTVSWAGMGA